MTLFRLFPHPFDWIGPFLAGRPCRAFSSSLVVCTSNDGRDASNLTWNRALPAGLAFSRSSSPDCCSSARSHGCLFAVRLLSSLLCWRGIRYQKGARSLTSPQRLYNVAGPTDANLVALMHLGVVEMHHPVCVTRRRRAISITECPGPGDWGPLLDVGC